MQKKISIVWLRRDLRLEDNTALFHALGEPHPVLLLFIFDTEILDELPDDDARVTFIYRTLNDLNMRLRSFGSSILVLKGDPAEIWPRLAEEYDPVSVFINRDYEPYAIERDQKVGEILNAKGITLLSYEDQVMFGGHEILKPDGSPYTVFTPYKRAWMKQYMLRHPAPLRFEGPSKFFPADFRFPSLQELGFKPSSVRVRSYDLDHLDGYARLRDIPSEDATSHLSPHLRFGTIGIRQVMSTLKETDSTFLSELIWREFFMQILFHFPDVVDQNFRPKYNGITWRNDESDFRRWCEGETGYPLVDAGMRELNATGYMHNRVRMVTAGFLCKHLLIDWRWGEAYFAGRLLDYELSSNNGNWQWAAGTGCDAAPYFRIFNPLEQARKFDPGSLYIRKWIPEPGAAEYPAPIVDHKFARERAIETYRKGLLAGDSRRTE